MKRQLLGLRSVAGVRAALVSTTEGVIVAAEAAGGVDAEAIAALASRFLGSASRAFAAAGRAAPERAELRGSEGRLLLAGLDGAFLAVLVGRESAAELESALEAARTRLLATRRAVIT